MILLTASDVGSPGDIGLDPILSKAGDRYVLYMFSISCFTASISEFRNLNLFRSSIVILLALIIFTWKRLYFHPQ